MAIHRASFFVRVRPSLFGGKMSAPQASGLGAMLDSWEAAYPEGDRRWLAYMLATAFHETARTCQPVRETLARTDEAAITILNRAFKAGKLPWVKTPYWHKDAEGKSWLGRGLVQITHKANYQRVGEAIGADLLTDPDTALDMDIAIRIMLTGMTKGLFTGKALKDYFTKTKTDWVGARAIINGRESAETVAAHAKAFYNAIN